jgi:hypothetical protein
LSFEYNLVHVWDPDGDEPPYPAPWNAARIIRCQDERFLLNQNKKNIIINLPPYKVFGKFLIVEINLSKSKRQIATDIMSMLNFHKQKIKILCSQRELFPPPEPRDKDSSYTYNKMEVWKMVLMIYVASEDLEDAFRLFMILNDRGIPLRNSDILKSMNLGALELDTEKIKYAKLWEEAEGELGDDFDRFLNHVRTILVKERPRLSLLREFEDKIYDPKEKDKATGQQKPVLLKKGKETFALIEKYLNHYKTMLGGQNYDDIGNFKFDNLIKTMWVGLPATDWMPPLLRYFDRFGYTRLMDFMHKLDNKFSADWIGQKTPTDRIEAMNDVIKVIDLAISGDEVLNSTCFDFDQDAFLRVLDGPVYGRRFTKYLMLKLDYYYQNHDQKMHFETLSVEHILPQNPADDSRWVMDFSSAEREEGTHKLGNLVLITCGKNTAQGRKDFADKVRSYFLKNIDTCPNSLRVLNNYHQWTPTELQNNHETVIQKIREYYGVQCIGQGLKPLVPKIIGLTAAVEEKKSSGSRETMQWDELSFFQDFDTRNLLEESKIARKVIEWAKPRMSSANPWGKGVSYGTFYPKFIFKDITIPFFNVFSSGRIEISFREIKKVSAFDGDAKRLELLHRLNQVPGISLSSDFINRYPTILLSVLKDDATLNQFLGVFDWVIKEIKSESKD